MTPMKTTNSVRVLVVSDLHFNKEWFDWVQKQAALHLHDGIIIAGDLIGPVWNCSAKDQVAWLTRWIKTFPGKRLVLCSGNHDQRPDDVPPALQNWMEALDYPHVTTDRQNVDIRGWGFECVPWNAMPLRGGLKQIAVCHCPPEGAKTAINDPECVDFGDFELGEWLRRPLGRHGYPQPPYAVLSGHTHRRRRWWDRVGKTWSLNTGVGASVSVPNHIVLTLGNVATAELWVGGTLTDKILLGSPYPQE